MVRTDLQQVQMILGKKKERECVLKRERSHQTLIFFHVSHPRTVSLFPFALFSKINVKLNGTSITNNPDMSLMYKQWLEIMLSYSDQHKSSFLKEWYFDLAFQNLVLANLFIGFTLTSPRQTPLIDMRRKRALLLSLTI